MARGKTGKLTWVARAIVTGTLTGPDPDDEVARDCADLGIAPPMPAPDGQSLWACHLAPVNAYLAVSGQWRVAPLGSGFRFMGLDYTAAQAGLKLAGITLTPGEWADLRVIEGAAKAALNGE